MATKKAVKWFLLCILFYPLRPSLGLAQGPALLKQSDLLYEGAFRLPRGKAGKSSFAYGGWALAYNPANDSLFIVGHDHQQMVGEISIPQVINSKELRELSTARVLQPLTDATEGKMFTVDKGTIKIGGLMVYRDKLYITAYSYYDANSSQRLSHFSRPLELSTEGQVSGPFEVGALRAGFVSGYMTHIPREWQDHLGGPAITGNCCIAIVNRTSFGPSAFAFDPADLGIKNSAPATPLVYYNSSHTTLGGWKQAGAQFNGTAQIRGLVFPEGTNSLLYFGRIGKGSFCYGTGATCKDPVSRAQGTHAYPYAYQVWAYDAQDLKNVKDGHKNPWDIVPYAVWNFELPFQHPARYLGGVAYDRATQRIFVAQFYAETNGMPMIHVFRIGASTLKTPLAPTNLRVTPE